MQTNGDGLRIINSYEDYEWEMDVTDAEKLVIKLVRVPLNLNQFSALVCFVVAEGKLRFRYSSILAAVNRGSFHQAARGFMRYGSKTDPIITKRRQQERALFTKPILIKSRRIFNPCKAARK